METSFFSPLPDIDTINLSTVKALLVSIGRLRSMKTTRNVQNHCNSIPSLFSFFEVTASTVDLSVPFARRVRILPHSPYPFIPLSSGWGYAKGSALPPRTTLRILPTHNSAKSIVNVGRRFLSRTPPDVPNSARNCKPAAQSGKPNPRPTKNKIHYN